MSDGGTTVAVQREADVQQTLCVMALKANERVQLVELVQMQAGDGKPGGEW